jgi:hypothetical protein
VPTIEGADSANGDIRRDRDVLATVTPSFALQILRMDLAALIGWLESTAGDAEARRTGGQPRRGVQSERPLGGVTRALEEGVVDRQAVDSAVLREHPTDARVIRIEGIGATRHT